MNTQRIVAGGLLAGLLINAGGAALAALAGNAGAGTTDLAALSGALPLPVALFRGFLLGVFCMLLYVTLRSHFRPGPRTAATAGLLAFIFGVLFPPFGTSLTNTLPAATLLAATVGQAIVLPLATIAGAWLYREAEHGASVPATVA